MKCSEDVYNDLNGITDLTRVIAMYNSEGMNYTHEELSSSFRAIWLQLDHVCVDLEVIVNSKQ
jgi:hypothetical protein